MSKVAATQFTLKRLCASEGSLDYSTVQQDIASRFGLSGPDIGRVLNDSRHFAVVERSRAVGSTLTPGSLVIALTSVRLCKDYPQRDCEDCGKLHLCRRLIYDDCRTNKAKKPCATSHDLRSPHNEAILSHNGLGDLDFKELRQLLLQNDPTLLPEVCSFYNRGEGPYGSCNYKGNCRKLHICLLFLLEACPLGGQCGRSHSFLENRSRLEKCRLNIEMICDLPSMYRNICEIRRREALADKVKGPSSNHSPSNAGSEEICLFFLRKHCSFKDRCKLVHFKLPYRWQVYDEAWTDLPDMEQIEKDYCDPKIITRASPPAVNFQTMSSSGKRVRRLSTTSSVTKPPHYTLTTEWLWYWQLDTGDWMEYGKQQGSDTVTSAVLENVYLADSKEKAAFLIGTCHYIVDFEAMIQRNVLLGTCRELRRRPRFVSEQEMERLMYRNDKTKEEPAQSKPVPAHWEMSAPTANGYQLIRLSDSSGEYKQVQSLFQWTMRNNTVRKIERIQNPALWEVYQWQKEQMKKKNGGKEVAERHLFCGWDSSPTATVCAENFDWRTCGTHGEGYGKGSYFATDASSADNYFSTTSAAKTMFLARVLVGQFSKGRPDYCRPPSKDTTYTNLYDSCANDCSNPSIFVIFEKHQIYPEYIIEYNNKVGFFQWMLGVMSGRSATAK
ncbi:protein mono-ADP-ribosyltransferase PARP12-like [Mustelus asterias]